MWTSRPDPLIVGHLSQGFPAFTYNEYCALQTTDPHQPSTPGSAPTDATPQPSADWYGRRCTSSSAHGSPRSTIGSQSFSSGWKEYASQPPRGRLGGPAGAGATVGATTNRIAPVAPRQERQQRSLQLLLRDRS